MRYKFIPLLLLIFISCSQNSDQQQPTLTSDFGKPKKLVAFLEQNRMAWWTYHKKYVVLSKEFIPLDEQAKQISKGKFLKRLKTGNFLAIRLNSLDGRMFYKLYPLSPKADPNIIEMIQDDVAIAYNYYSMEGKRFPYFDLIDLTGETYTWDNTRGKTLVINTWFTGCGPCVEEMPDLNRLVKLNNENDDLLFISLALDSEERLKKFLASNDFDYAIVPKAGAFIGKELGLRMYPTHVIVNGDGDIAKVINTFSELNWSIAEVTDAKRLPPPPPKFMN